MNRHKRHGLNIRIEGFQAGHNSNSGLFRKVNSLLPVTPFSRPGIQPMPVARMDILFREPLRLAAHSAAALK